MFQDFVSILVTKFTGWWDDGVEMLPNLMVALAVAALFYVLAKIAQRFVGKTLAGVVTNHTVLNLAGSITMLVILSVGLFTALGVMGLQKAVTSLLAGAGLIGLALGFAFQDLASNLIAGVYIGLRRPFRQGDLIKTNGVMGTVIGLNLRNTIIRDFNGRTCLLPNNKVFQELLINYDFNGKRRIDIPVGVAYDTDLATARTVVKEALNSLDWVVDKDETDVAILQFGASSIDMEARYWIAFPNQISYPEALSQGIIAIHKAFQQHDIDIPFPIRTLAFAPQSPALPIETANVTEISARRRQKAAAQ